MARLSYFVFICLFIMMNFSLANSYLREFDYRMCHGERDLLVLQGFTAGQVERNCEKYATGMENSLLGIRRL